MGRRIGFVVVVLVVAAHFIAAQTPPSLQGVWRVTSVVTTGAGASNNPSPQPGIYIFTKQHYSIIFVRGTAPRKAVPDAANPAKLTDAEKITRFEAYDPYTANSGTYETKGATVTTHAIVAKNPGSMGTSLTREFKITGNTLTVVQKSSPGEPISQTTTTLTRIE